MHLIKFAINDLLHLFVDLVFNVFFNLAVDLLVYIFLVVYKLIKTNRLELRYMVFTICDFRSTSKSLSLFFFRET
jgi:hypothetical protein